MSYATPQDYKQYGGGLIPDEELERALSRASDQIDSLTYNRIVARGFDNLTPFQQTNVKKAVCLQADFNRQYGDYLAIPMGGFSAGSISWNFQKGDDSQGGGGVKASDDVMNLLLPTGLANRGLRR